MIGVGSMGWNHARIYNELDGVDLGAVADVDGRVAEPATPSMVPEVTPTIERCCAMRNWM